MLIASCGALLLPCAAAAQRTTPAPFGFISTRYSNTASDFILVGYGYGESFGLVGIAHNPRTGYNEMLGGLGRRFFNASPNSFDVAIAYSEATDSPYMQLYLLPSFELGRATGEGIVQLSLPASPTGMWKLGVKPMAMFTRLKGPLSLGGSYQMMAQENAIARHLAGPQFRLSVPRGVVVVELLEGFKRTSDEFRVSFRAGF